MRSSKQQICGLRKGREAPHSSLLEFRSFLTFSDAVAAGLSYPLSAIVAAGAKTGSRRVPRCLAGDDEPVAIPFMLSAKESIQSEASALSELKSFEATGLPLDYRAWALQEFLSVATPPDLRHCRTNLAVPVPKMNNSFSVSSRL